MREFTAVIFLFVVIAMGWNQPFREHARSFSRIFSGHSTPAPEAPAAAAPGATPVVIIPATPAPYAGAPASDGSWRFEKTKMDEPHSKRSTQHGR